MKQEEVEKKLTELHDSLVPASGMADTIEGELVRAINKIWYRYFNDGDFFFKGYGLETVAPSMNYLTDSVVGNEVKPSAKKMLSVRSKLSSKRFSFPGQFEEATDPYLRGIVQIAETIIKYIEMRNGNYTPNSVDSRS